MDIPPLTAAVSIADLAAIAFIFAVFWGVAIAGMHSFKAFHIWLGTPLQALGRLFIGVVVVNLWPMVLILYIYHVVEKIPNAKFQLFCAGIASLSVFSIVFFLPAAIHFFGRKFYPEDSLTSECTTHDINLTTSSARFSIFVGIAYVILPLGFCRLATHCPALAQCLTKLCE